MEEQENNQDELFAEFVKLEEILSSAPSENPAEDEKSNESEDETTDVQPIFDEYYSARLFDSVFASSTADEKSAKKPVLKDPKGGLTAAGRAYFKRTEGANLKPGVRGPANTPEKMRRKGSFLTRFFTNPSGPMVDEKGRATRLALSAAAWGERVPKNMEDAAKLAAKGRRLLDRYGKTKKKSDEIEDRDTAEINFARVQLINKLSRRGN